MFKNIFGFNGRIRRQEYIVTYVLIFLISFTLGLVTALFGFRSEATSIVSTLFLSYIQIAQGVKRVHDSGKSGWYILIPFYNLYLLLFVDSDYGYNDYGPNPKGEGNDDLSEVDEYLKS